MIGMGLGMIGVYETISDFFGSLLVLWTLPFFIFLGLYVGISLLCILKDFYWPIGVYSVILFLLLAFFGQLHPIDYMLEHPWYFLGYVLGYFVIGLFWMSFRYIRFLHRMRHEREKCLKDFIESMLSASSLVESKMRDRHEGDPVITDAVINTWVSELKATGMAPKTPKVLYENLNDYLSRKMQYRDRSMVDYGTADEPPLWQNHKSDFAAIWCYWPLDMLYYFIGDFLRDVFRWISKYLQGIFDRIARNTVIKPIK